MMLAPVSAIEKRLGVAVGSLTGTDEARAEASLEDASALVLAAGNPTWTDSSAPAIVVAVTIRSALRAYQNPEGIASEVLGDYQVRRTSADVGAFLTDAEERLIQRAAGATGGAYSFRTPAAFETTARTGETFYAPVSGGQSIPWQEAGDP